MGLLINKKKVYGGIRGLAYVDLFISLAGGLVTTIWALYIDSFVHSDVLTGLVSGLLTFVSIVSYFLLIPLVERSDKGKLHAISLVLIALSYFVLTFNKSFLFFLFISIAVTIVYTIRISTFGIIVKDKSKKGKLAENEGFIYTFLNIGWLIGPLLAGYIANLYGVEPIFFLGGVTAFAAFLLFKYWKIKDSHIKKRVDCNLIRNFIDFFKDRRRVLAYLIDGGSATWWVLIYLYMPLFIIDKGLNELWVGYFLFGVALPLIILEYPFSKITGKYGFKRAFKIGFISLAVFSIACYFISNIFLIILALVMASFGMAFLEPMTEAYFLTLLKGDEASRFYGPFNTTRDVNQFISKILASLMLIFLPFKSIFLLFGAIMVLIFFLVFKIEEN